MYVIKQNNSIPLHIQLLIVIYFVLELFETFLNATFGSYVKFYIIFVIFEMIRYHGFKLKKNKVGFFFLLWLLYKMLTVLWCKNLYVFQLHFFTNITSVLLLYVLTMDKLDRKIIDHITYGLLIGSGSLGFLSLFFNTPYLGVTNRLVLQLFGQIIDPNDEAAFLAVGLAISLFILASSERDKKLKIFSAVILFVNTYALLLTGSRGGLLTEVTLVIVLSLFKIRNGKNKLIFCIAILLVICSSYYYIQKWLPQDIYSRLFETSTYEGGSNRTNIWSNAINLMNSNPIFYFFGSGWGSYYGYNGYNVVMHNTFLSMLCDTGIIGIFLFFTPIIKATAYLYRKKEILPILLLLAGLVPSIFLEAINKRFFWNAILFLLIYYKYILFKNRIIINGGNK